jgi:uncharacterized membrane-anchored protein YitT (DUF2179 family)
VSPSDKQFRSRSGHSFFEDVQGLLTGTLLVALAVLFFKTAALLTGGTTGLAFLIHYPSGWRIGAILFVINLPFYIFGYKALGRAFTIKTFVSVGLLSFYIEALPRWIHIQDIQPVFAAIMGGLLAGTGILILIRHGASLGGVSIMAIYLQKARQWRAGMVQMAFDVAILLLGLWVLSPSKVLLSVLGAFALNMVIAINHRTGRYFTV